MCIRDRPKYTQSFNTKQPRKSCNKCSAIAEMDDHLATIDMGRKEGRGSGAGLLCPFWRGELGPHLKQCGLGRDIPPYQVSSSSIQPFGHNRHGPIKKPRKGVDVHRRQHARLVAAYLQSQSQGCSLGQCGDFRNFRRSVTLTLMVDRVKVTSTYIYVYDYQHAQ